MGLGAWSWGDRSGYWSWKPEDKADNLAAYKTMLESGIDFLDTAEVYGFGLSEELVGEFMRETGTTRSVQVATKFAPLPNRILSPADDVVSACRASLRRLDLQQMAVYIQHWPGFFLNSWSNEGYLDGLARIWELGLARAVGVSNFNAERTSAAARMLEGRGTCLSSNQVHYSLLYREPERNGVLEACREHGVTLVAYSPLCQGLLSGKYDGSTSKPTGPRSALISGQRFEEIRPLLDLLRAVGAEHGGKTPTQVALNWCICKGTLPIPGAKSAKQVFELAGALGWRLPDDAVVELDAVSGRIKSSSGAPFENW